MKRRIALLLVICLLTSMVPAAMAGDAVGDDIPGNGIEIVDVDEQDLAGPLESDGIELDSDGLPDEIGDILPGGDMPELELGASLDLTDGDALLSESEAQGDVPETNDDSSDFTIKNGVLTKYNGTGGDVVIPDGVTSIGRYAFMKNDSLKSVTIPDSVTELDIYAFAYCPNLISVKMMEGLKSIGDFAFAGCSGLKNIAIPKSVTVMGDEVFVECSSLESITVPGNVKSQFFWTFMHCTNLKHVTLEEGIMTIGKSEFSGCSNLTDIDIPGTLTSIDERAFYDCEKLKSIKLPDNLVSIGKNAFDSCKSLTTVVIPRQISDIKDQAFIRCSSLESVTIPEGVTRIGEAAFNGCNKLSSVTIPASVTKIGEAAFAGAITIKGYTGSYAETYAKKNKLTFVPLDAPAPEISIPKKLSLGVKETYALDAAGASFKSSNTAVAAVDKKGVVTAKKAGSATVTVTVDKKKVGTCKVTVVKAPTSISFAEKSVTLGVKETLALKPTITKGSHASYTWSVKDKKIATVDKDGVVTGKKAGKTTVTVKTHNGKKATVTVTVQKAPTKVSLPKKAVTLGVKEALTLTPKIAKGAHTSFTWTVEDSKIATVTKSGKITGKKAGKTTVTVKTHNGKKATVTVTVMKAPTKVSLEAKTMALGVKESVKLKPEIARDAHTSYTWTVKNKKIATVTKDGKLTGKKAGKTTVTVKTHNGKKATMTVNVMAAPGSITLSGKSRNLTVGDAIMLMPTLPKKTASRITWSSSKKSVASVDADGVVRALKKGTAKITAKTFNGKKAVCTVTVGEGASYLAFDAEALSVGVKEKVTLKPQVNEGARVKYTWTTGNKKVATVSKKGVVTGVKAGTTEITVKTQNGLTATVKVTVLAAPKKVTLGRNKAEIAAGYTLQLKATLPKQTASSIKWATSNKKVAVIDQTGLVTAVAPGKATITAKTFNGKQDKCVVTVRKAEQEDSFNSFIDAYEALEKTSIVTKHEKIDLLMPDELGDADGLDSFIEEYNGLATIINKEIDAYNDYLAEFEAALGDISHTDNMFKVNATEDYITVQTGAFSFKMPTDIQGMAKRNGISLEKAIFSNAELPEVGPDGIEAFANGAKDFLGVIGTFIQRYSAFVKGMDPATFDLNHNAKILRDLIEEKLKDTKRGSKLRTVLETALKKMKGFANGCKQLRYAMDAVADMWEEFEKKQIAAGLAVGIDAIYAAQVAVIWGHGHPIKGRECEDYVRNGYTEKLKSGIQSSTVSIVKDVVFNVGMAAAEFNLFKNAGGKLFGKFVLSKSAEKWLKFAFTGADLYFSSKIGQEVEERYNKMHRFEDILHGEIRGTISGKVIDADTKKPIAGALVETDEKSKTTKADGSFVLSAMYGDYSGKYAVKCTKEGYVDGTGEVVVDEDASDAEVTIELSVEGVPIDEVHFPDANFRIKVREFDLDGNESLSDEEIEKITTVAVENCGIGSLEGIQYFTAMKKLSCRQNKLTSLDIMECAALRKLDCSENALTVLKVAGHKMLETLYCFGNPLTMLDVSWCPKLKTVYCTTTYGSESSGKLKGLNASGCSALNLLDCSYNVLTLLDVSGCTALQTLDCSYNRLTSVTTSGVSSGSVLSLNGCTGLRELRCNNNQLTGLSVKGCAGLQKLFCNSNKLTGLDVGGMTKLTDLNCGGNQLTSLNVSGCAVLQVLNCAVNKLKALDISACPSLQVLYCTSNQIEVLEYLDIKRLKFAQYDHGTDVVVPFGHYDQDNNPSNGKEPIEWLVLEDKGDTLTLISRYALDAKPYHNEWVYITWANCTLRSWLNGTFLNAAFTSAEQGKIQTVRVTAEDNPYWGTEAGSDTYDKVWLLSIREAKNLFSSNAARVCYATATAKANGCGYNSDGSCWWWLRSPGGDSLNAAGVHYEGWVDKDFNYNNICNYYGAVRPVVCLRLS